MKRSNVNGCGLFAVRAFNKGDVIVPQTLLLPYLLSFKTEGVFSYTGEWLRTVADDGNTVRMQNPNRGRNPPFRCFLLVFFRFFSAYLYAMAVRGYSDTGTVVDASCVRGYGGVVGTSPRKTHHYWRRVEAQNNQPQPRQWCKCSCTANEHATK